MPKSKCERPLLINKSGPNTLLGHTVYFAINLKSQFQNIWAVCVKQIISGLSFYVLFMFFSILSAKKTSYYFTN